MTPGRMVPQRAWGRKWVDRLPRVSLPADTLTGHYTRGHIPRPRRAEAFRTVQMGRRKPHRPAGRLEECGGVEAEQPGQDANVRLAQFALGCQYPVAEAAVAQQSAKIGLGHFVLGHKASQQFHRRHLRLINGVVLGLVLLDEGRDCLEASHSL